MPLDPYLTHGFTAVDEGTCSAFSFCDRDAHAQRKGTLFCLPCAKNREATLRCIEQDQPEPGLEEVYGTRNYLRCHGPRKGRTPAQRAHRRDRRRL